MNRWTYKLRRITWQQAYVCGLVGSIIIAITSHMCGATRTRGGIMQALGLTSLTFGHMTGIMVVIMWIGVLLLMLSWIVVGGHILRHGRSLTTKMTTAWIAPLFFAGPIMSRDLYSYLMQGTLARDGINAYEHGAAANPGPLLFEVSADWRNTTTPYGPLHLWIGDLITSVTGDNITAGLFAYKILSIASVVVMMWAVARLARHFGHRASVAVWLGVVNPLSIIHLIGGMHNENIMMALVLVGLYAGVKMGPWRGLVAGATLIAMAVSIKATAFIALPFLGWIAVARIAGRAPGGLFRETFTRVLTLCATGIAMLGITSAVVSLVTMLSGQTWGWIAEVTGNTKVINPLALPSFIASSITPLWSTFDSDITFNVVVNAVRPFSTILMMLGLIVVWWVFRTDELLALKGATLAYLVTCVFNSVTLPWYYTAALALIGVWTFDRRMIFFTAWFCLAMSMMFDGGGNNRLYSLWWVIGVCLLTFWMTRACLGYAPRRPMEKTDEWILHPQPREIQM
ncbi:alpha-(1-_6)-mannopyranosyltransferase A [Corynebacterium anserum]|uniref:Alpha-(1->6)-mannopyranosyltransferase A n=1 Tax=Corynebacterium anserum TaxID=2684406 RepID=A0A7G7YMX2_9CORY|nr:alpha-(1->6)-mannopyranosyltransferase A [Corynebacterium anserum]MBC2680928.1 alpha-(1->6)-mannopyranosyltransferase A [Corynebacterium anserum]QNH95842.1 alpha-(1->6)-mannopyranosyltransferase A [Corynebacterium anserum]